MTFCFSRANLRGSGKLWMLMLVVLISLLSIAQTPRAQAATATPSLGDKALSFLTDVIQLDLSKYKVTLYENTSNGEHLFYRLYPNDASPLFSASSDTLAIFNFHNGTLGSCDLSPGLGGLIYVHPFSDRFNATLGIVQRFETWANDSWATGMENLMAKVGSEKNVLEVSGNESLRITLYSSGFGIYQFSNYFEGVEYTGVTIAMGNSTGDLFFTDSRAFHKIGNTTINVSREQAINIAEDYVKNYSYKHTFGNGTSITVSNLNVTGISSAGLKSDIGENSMLFPYWDVRVNVSNMPARGLQGVGVVISANDGTVKSAYQFTSISIGPLISLILFPTYQLLLTILAILIAVAIGIIIILVVILRKTKEKPPSKN